MENVVSFSSFNLSGHPALSINAGFSEGLPVGMMIAGRKFDEVTVLNVAYAYEKIRDANDKLYDFKKKLFLFPGKLAFTNFLKAFL